MGRLAWVVFALAGAAAVAGTGRARGARTTLTIWAATPPVVTAFGGASYGGPLPPAGATVTERRELEVGPSGEVTLAGVAPTLDPTSVELRDATDPAGTVVREQRFVPGATTPDEILARHVGEAVSIATAKGDVEGVLRAVDAKSLVIETGSGDARRVQVLQRDGFVREVRLAAGTSVDAPRLVWRLATRQPGTHAIEVTYRADGLVWSPQYSALLDEAGKTVELTASATVKNLTGTSFDAAELVLASAQPPPAQLFPLASPVSLRAGESVQVELFPRRAGAKARPVVTFEAMQDPSPGYQGYPATDCNLWAATTSANARAEQGVELEVPARGPLPDGRVRVLRKHGERVEPVSEEPLRSSAGLARLRVGANADVTGDRKATSCTFDERARTVSEKVEVRVENRGTQVADVVVREYLWRWPVWRIDPADETVKGARAGTQAQEYRVRLAPGSKQVVAYRVTYSW